MRTTLLAKSSSGDPYELIFELSDNGLLTATCCCAAAHVGQLCKHVLALLGGDCSMLFNPAAETEALNHLLKIVGDCEIGPDYSALLARLRDLDLEFKQTK